MRIARRKCRCCEPFIKGSYFMYSNEQRFAWDIDALREILNNQTPKNLLDASVILRRLLMDDGGPLLVKVSKSIDHKLIFRANSGVSDAEDHGLLTKGSLFLWENPSCRVTSPDHLKSMGLDEFLKLKTHYVEGNYLTVNEIVKYCANVGGGVHQGIPKEKHNAKLIHETKEILSINGVPYPLWALVQLIEIIIDASIPIYDRLRA